MQTGAAGITLSWLYLCMTHSSIQVLLRVVEHYWNRSSHSLVCLSVCLSHACSLQKPQHGSWSCLRWRPKKHCIRQGFRFSPWIRCGLCQITLARCLLCCSLWQVFWSVVDWEAYQHSQRHTTLRDCVRMIWLPNPNEMLGCWQTWHSNVTWSPWDI